MGGEGWESGCGKEQEWEAGKEAGATDNPDEWLMVSGQEGGGGSGEKSNLGCILKIRS